MNASVDDGCSCVPETSTGDLPPVRPPRRTHVRITPQQRVYLAGPITGKTMDDARAWRIYAAGMLGEAGIQCLSPLRGKEHLAGDGPLPNDFDGGFAAVAQDLDDIDRCNAVLAYFGDAEVASIGTCCEIGYAYNDCQTIIAVVPEHGVHDHVFIKYMADRIVRSLDDGIEAVKEALHAS